VRHREGYDYLHHCEVDSDNKEFVTDDVVDRFCLLGPAQTQIQKLKTLAGAGVTQFNLYLMSGDEEEQLRSFQHEVMAGLR
jgi:hypothetical protein